MSYFCCYCRKRSYFYNMLPVAEIVLPVSASGIPAFLAKLWKMVDDPDTDHLIAWGDFGNSFVIYNQAEFSQSLLPYYYKHSNMASFVRQLNMYGFHKVVGVEAGGLKSEKDQEMEFAHPYFHKGQHDLLIHIKRKVATSKAPIAGNAGQFAPAPAIKSERVNEVLNEVTQLKDKQEDMDSKLGTMKKENEALWREVINLRQKHSNQQKIVNKLIHFLMGCLQGGVHPGRTVKRQYTQPLAIESRGPKQAKFDSPGGQGTGVNLKVTSAAGGPFIYDVTNTDDGNMVQNETGSGNTSEAQPKIDIPMSPLSEAMRAIDPSLVNPAISLQGSAPSVNSENSGGLGNQTSPFNFNISNLISPSQQSGLPSTSNTVATVASTKENTTPTRPTLQRELSKEDFDADTFFMENEIDNLKQILSGQIKMDTNMISNLFDPSVPLYFSGKDPITGKPIEQTQNLPAVPQKLPLEMEVPEEATNNSEPPTLFELADIDDTDEDLMMPPPSLGGSNKDNYYSSLETPLILDSALALDENPLVAQIKSARKGKKKN